MLLQGIRLGDQKSGKFAKHRPKNMILLAAVSKLSQEQSVSALGTRPSGLVVLAGRGSIGLTEQAHMLNLRSLATWAQSNFKHRSQI